MFIWSHRFKSSLDQQTTNFKIVMERLKEAMKQRNLRELEGFSFSVYNHIHASFWNVIQTKAQQ